MTRRRPFGISRRILLVFVLVVLFCYAQIAWWITFQMSHSGEDLAFRQEHFEQDRLLATLLIAQEAARRGADPPLPGEILARHFPHLEWDPAAEPGPGLGELYQQGAVAVRPAETEALREARSRRLRMFASEGAFFLGIVSIGVFIIFHALRREVALKRQQSNFISAVTHELKSPLASIRLFAETLELRDVKPEKRVEYLRAIAQDVDRLEGLVGNLLTAARLESGRIELHPERSDLVRDVAETLEPLRSVITERGVRLEVDLPEERIPVRSDLRALRAILRNLLDNAVKYGGRGKTVRVRVARERDRAVLEVSDEGMGLPPEEQERVFEKFYRVGDELVRQVEGSGLGLYLVRALARGSGGDVVARSDGPGRGSTFRVTFPLDRQEAA